MQISHNCIYTCFPSLLSLVPSSHPTPLGHHQAPGWAARDAHQLPAACLFDTWQCVCTSATVSTHPTLSLPRCARKSVLCVCVSIHQCHFSRFLKKHGSFCIKFQEVHGLFGAHSWAPDVQNPWLNFQNLLNHRTAYRDVLTRENLSVALTAKDGKHPKRPTRGDQLGKITAKNKNGTHQ